MRASLRAHRGARAGLHLGRGEGRRAPTTIPSGWGAPSTISRATGASIRSTRSSTRRSPKSCGRRSRSADRSAPRPDGRPRRSSVTRRASRGAATPARTSRATAASTSRPGCSASTCPTWCRWRKPCAASPPSPRQLYGFADRGSAGRRRARRSRGVGPARAGDRGHPVVGGLPRGRWALRRRRDRATARSSSTARSSDCDGADTGARPGRVLRFRQHSRRRWRDSDPGGRWQSLTYGLGHGDRRGDRLPARQHRRG